MVISRQRRRSRVAVVGLRQQLCCTLIGVRDGERRLKTCDLKSTRLNEGEGLLLWRDRVGGWRLRYISLLLFKQQQSTRERREANHGMSGHRQTLEGEMKATFASGCVIERNE